MFSLFVPDSLCRWLAPSGAPVWNGTTATPIPTPQVSVPVPSSSSANGGHKSRVNDWYSRGRGRRRRGGGQLRADLQHRAVLSEQSYPAQVCWSDMIRKETGPTSTLVAGQWAREGHRLED